MCISLHKCRSLFTGSTANIGTRGRQLIEYDIFMTYYTNNTNVYSSILETLAIVREPLMFRWSYFNTKFRLLR